MTRRLLLVGPLPRTDDVIGGTKVSFRGLVDQLRASPRFEVDVIDTARPLAGRGPLRRAASNATALVGTIGRVLLRAGRADAVLVNVSSRGALLSAPLAWMACRLRRRPLGVRLFGGDFDLAFESASAPLRWVARHTFLSSPMVLFQTRALCSRFAPESRVEWLPTTRELEVVREARDAQRVRFVFIGQLRAEKGLGELLEASSGLPPHASVEIFGPRMPGFDPASIDAWERARYGGALDAADVADVLASADVLVFPSYHPGEGLPGIVVEAMQAGLPVVAARWRALPELVEHGVNGLLVPPRDPVALRDALITLARDGALRERLGRGALQRGREFRGSTWSPRVEGWLEDLCELKRCA